MIEQAYKRTVVFQVLDERGGLVVDRRWEFLTVQSSNSNPFPDPHWLPWEAATGEWAANGHSEAEAVLNCLVGDVDEVQSINA